MEEIRLEETLLIRMEDLILLDEKKIIARKNIDYIQIFRKHQRDEKNLRNSKMGI